MNEKSHIMKNRIKQDLISHIIPILLFISFICWMPTKQNFNKTRFGVSERVFDQILNGNVKSVEQWTYNKFVFEGNVENKYWGLEPKTMNDRIGNCYRIDFDSIGRMKKYLLFYNKDTMYRQLREYKYNENQTVVYESSLSQHSWLRNVAWVFEENNDKLIERRYYEFTPSLVHKTDNPYEEKWDRLLFNENFKLIKKQKYLYNDGSLEKIINEIIVGIDRRQRDTLITLVSDDFTDSLLLKKTEKYNLKQNSRASIVARNYIMKSQTKYYEEYHSNDILNKQYDLSRNYFIESDSLGNISKIIDNRGVVFSYEYYNYDEYNNWTAYKVYWNDELYSGRDGLREPLKTVNLNHQTFCCIRLHVNTLLVVLLCSLFSGEGGIQCPFFAPRPRFKYSSILETFFEYLESSKKISKATIKGDSIHVSTFRK